MLIGSCIGCGYFWSFRFRYRNRERGILGGCKGGFLILLRLEDKDL